MLAKSERNRDMNLQSDKTLIIIVMIFLTEKRIVQTATCKTAIIKYPHCSSALPLHQISRHHS